MVVELALPYHRLVLALDEIPVPAPFAHLRRFALDGAMLLFDRGSGWNVRCEGEETAHLRLCAPRVVQFGITNACNLACTFCSRDLEARSAWTAGEAFEWLAELARAGVLEVAFGGGEPLAFRGFERLVRRLHDETPLAVNFTTNGLRLDKRILRELDGVYGEIRLSLYDDNGWRERVTLLANGGARFGVNWLMTPERLERLEETVCELVELGARRILVLSYNGRDRALHLDVDQTRDLEWRICLLSRALARRCQIELDVCWGERLERVPRLFAKKDCGAGREFVVLTSDKRVQPCSFHSLSIPVASAAELLGVWRGRRDELASASTLPGCARVKGFGLAELPA